MSIRSPKVSHSLSPLSLHHLSLRTPTDSQHINALCCPTTAQLMYQILFISQISCFCLLPVICCCVWSEIPLCSFHTTYDHLLLFTPFGNFLIAAICRRWIPPPFNTTQLYIVAHIISSYRTGKGLCLQILLTFFVTQSVPFALSHLIPPFSTVLKVKLTDTQPVKKFSSFYGNRKFITTFTTARHLFLSSAKSIHFLPSYPTSWISILLLSWVFQVVSSFGFPHQNPLFPSPLLISPPCLPTLFSIWSNEQYLVSTTDH